MCLNRAVKLDRNWGYHMDMMKILSKYIFEKVDLQILLNGFATEMRTSINYAIMFYPQYKDEVRGLF